VILAALAAHRAPAQDLLVQAGRVVVAPDTVLSPGRLLLRQGKVVYVGGEIPEEARARASVVDYGDATLVPGFVLAQSTLGQDADLAEGALAFTPDLRAAEAFDPWLPELEGLPAEGITSLALSPSPRNVAAGLAALVKPGRDGGRLAVPELQLVLSLSQAARNPERQPTSLMGAMDLLRTTFTAARTGVHTGPDAAVMRSALQGSRRVFVHADTYAELCAALDLAREFAFEPVLVGADQAEKVLPRLVQQKARIVLGSLQPESRLQQLRLPTRLAEAGVPFCFAGSGKQLRLTAALAVRAGLDRTTALAALTRLPAAMLDQEKTVGSLREGCAADFVVFAGDPLDLDSAHRATWIDGECVHGERPRAATKPQAPVTSDPTKPVTTKPLTSAGDR
jgi:imidazolonepropionase-like amidohydrolase